MARLSRQTKSQPDVSIRRTLFVAAFVAFWMVGISARLVQLQVTQHDKLVARARQQQQDAIETSPTRGPVLDRAERELARTIDTTSVSIAPDEFRKHKDDTDAQISAAIESSAQSLSSLLGLNQKAVVDQINDAKSSGCRKGSSPECTPGKSRIVFIQTDRWLPTCLVSLGLMVMAWLESNRFT